MNSNQHPDSYDSLYADFQAYIQIGIKDGLRPEQVKFLDATIKGIGLRAKWDFYPSLPEKIQAYIQEHGPVKLRDVVNVLMASNPMIKDRSAWSAGLKLIDSGRADCTYDFGRNHPRVVMIGPPGSFPKPAL